MGAYLGLQALGPKTIFSMIIAKIHLGSEKRVSIDPETIFRSKKKKTFWKKCGVGVCLSCVVERSVINLGRGRWAPRDGGVPRAKAWEYKGA